MGDDATLEAVADNIRQRWPNAEIIALSMNPDDTERRHGIKSYPLRRNGWSIEYAAAEAGGSLKAKVKELTRKHKTVFILLKAMNSLAQLPYEMSFLASARRTIMSFDLLIISGGGQLTEKSGSWNFPYTIFIWVILAKSTGVRCIFLNVGAGPLTRPLSKFFARRALCAADYVSLRDSKSRALVREIGFPGESQLYPDSAYALDVAATTGSVRETVSRSIVGLAPMPYPGYPESDRVVYDAFIGKLASFASWLISRSYALELFGTDIRVDPPAIGELQRSLQISCGIPSSQFGINHSEKSVRGVLATMSRMDYVVTCRFHGVIFAHLLNKPVLAIAHHPKVTELMAEIELPDYCVDIRDFDVNWLTERFSSLVSNAEEIKSRMAASLMENRRQLTNQFDELFSVHREPSFFRYSREEPLRKLAETD
jgi:polysaccharide pyruvyl transferase WcaK-like protein